MKETNAAVYRPRPVTNLGIWDFDPLSLKVYGITAEGQTLNDEIVADAYAMTQRDLPALVATLGEDNGLGFVIIHPGETGVSVLKHWWIQGSVLCQHVERKLWGATKPLGNRPVVACVWELGLINAEQVIWRETMMIDEPDADAYLGTFSDLTEV